MKKIRQKQSESSPSHTASAPLDLEIHQPDRSGLWAEIWQAYETGAFEKLLDECTEISIEWTREGDEVDMLDITVKKNEHEIYLDIDEDSLYMDAIDTGVDTTTALAEIGTLDNLFAQIQNFVRENT
jgi:hypothetical protein